MAQQQPCVDDGLRQALAVAIVRNKRRCIAELAESKAKAARLEAALEEQREQLAQLRHWAASTMRQTAPDDDGPCDGSYVAGHDNSASSSGVFLPPLPSAQACAEGVAPTTHWQDSYDQLQHQVLLSAAEAAGYGAVAQVMRGRASALGSMLLTNIQMLQMLKPAQQQAVTGVQPSSSRTSSFAPGSAAAGINVISSFIMGTLLHVPRSSLRAAYMQQSSALLAAILAPSGPAAAGAAPQALPTDRMPQGTHCDQPEALALQVVQLMQQLLQARAAGDAGAAAASPALSAGSSASAAAAATAMLQHLSSLPSTGLLLTLAAAQQLQQLVQQQQEAATQLASLSLGAMASRMQELEQVAASAAAGFQNTHQLLDELDTALAQLPAWGVAIAHSSWVARALEDLVDAASTMYAACPSLNQQQPLLAERVCVLLASLATQCQHLASNADAPGMRTGTGAELRSVAGGLCRRLRDLFMPA